MKYWAFIICIVVVQNSFGQNKLCKLFYDNPEIIAKYGKEEFDLYNFSIDSLLPIIVKSDNVYPEKLSIIFKIDLYGRVVDVDFLKIKYSDICRSELLKKCQEMGNWLPAANNRINVCSKYKLNISCINWQ